MVLRAHSGTGSTVFDIPQFRPDIFGQLCFTNVDAGANHDKLPLIAFKDTNFALPRTAAYVHVQDHFLPPALQKPLPDISTTTETQTESRHPNRRINNNNKVNTSRNTQPRTFPAASFDAHLALSTTNRMMP